MERDYYVENKKAKAVLMDLMKRFNAHLLSVGDANRYNVTYTDEDICPFSSETIMCVFHMYEANGLHMWNMLGIDKNIISLSEFEQIKENYVNEERNSELNYEVELSKTKLLVYSYIKSNYFTNLSLEEIVKNKISFDIDMDYNSKCDRVYVYDNYKEEVGVNAFNLLGIKNNIITQLRFCEMEANEIGKLLELETNKEKVKSL